MLAAVHNCFHTSTASSRRGRHSVSGMSVRERVRAFVRDHIGPLKAVASLQEVGGGRTVPGDTIQGGMTP